MTEVIVNSAAENLIETILNAGVKLQRDDVAYTVYEMMNRYGENVIDLDLDLYSNKQIRQLYMDFVTTLKNNY